MPTCGLTLLTIPWTACLLGLYWFSVLFFECRWCTPPYTSQEVGCPGDQITCSFHMVILNPDFYFSTNWVTLSIRPVAMLHAMTSLTSFLGKPDQLKRGLILFANIGIQHMIQEKETVGIISINQKVSWSHFCVACELSYLQWGNGDAVSSVCYCTWFVFYSLVHFEQSMQKALTSQIWCWLVCSFFCLRGHVLLYFTQSPSVFLSLALCFSHPL